VNYEQSISARGSNNYSLVNLATPKGIEKREPFNGFDYLAFLIPAFKWIEFDLVGSIYGGDLLVAGLLCYLLYHKVSFSSLKSSLPRRFLMLLAMWFAAQVLTDLVRATEVHDSARGWARILITMVHFPVLYVLLQPNRRRLVIYGWGLVAGSLLTYWFRPFIFADQYPWEFGWGFPITLAIILLTSAKTFSSLLLPLGIALLNLYLGFRSLGAICFLLTIYLLLRLVWTKSADKIYAAMPVKKMAAVVLMVAVGGWGVGTLYQKASSSGLLGEDAKYKSEFQSSGEFGLFLGGRSEILLGAIAIVDSPILGHGSWAKSPEYVAAYQAVMLMLGYDEASFQRGKGVGIGGEENDYLIVAHSTILGGWVEAGVVGALVWIWLFGVSFGSLRWLHLVPDELASISAFCALWTMWYMCFEPYGGDLRFNILYYAVVVMSCISLAKEKARGFSSIKK
jgi:hypothetical protein